MTQPQPTPPNASNERNTRLIERLDKIEADLKSLKRAAKIFKLSGA